MVQKTTKKATGSTAKKTPARSTRAKTTTAKKAAAPRTAAKKPTTTRTVKKVAPAPATKRVAAARGTRTEALKSDIFAIEPLSMLGTERVAMPEAVRSIAEKTLTQSRAAYEAAKDAVDDATDALETSIDQAGKNAKNFNLKLIDMAQENVEASFEFMRDLACAKDVTEAVAAQTTYVRRQIGAVSTHAKQISELTAKLAENASKPLKDQMSKSLTKFNIGG